MAKQTKTEGLRERIAKFLYHYRAITRRAEKDIVPWGKLNETYKNTYREDANYFLQAFKNAGGVFVDREAELPKILADPNLTHVENIRIAKNIIWEMGYRKTEEIEEVNNEN